MKQAHVFISGYVQGVGYRYFVRDNARKLGLKGFVRNTPARNASASVAGGADRRVEAVFQPSTSSGPDGEKKIEQMIALCRKGPMLSEIKDIQIDWEENDQELASFEVR